MRLAYPGYVTCLLNYVERPSTHPFRLFTMLNSAAPKDRYAPMSAGASPVEFLPDRLCPEAVPVSGRPVFTAARAACQPFFFHRLEARFSGEPRSRPRRSRPNQTRRSGPLRSCFPTPLGVGRRFIRRSEPPVNHLFFFIVQTGSFSPAETGKIGASKSPRNQTTDFRKTAGALQCGARR
jgi:hypothetical protein